MKYSLILFAINVFINAFSCDSIDNNNLKKGDIITFRFDFPYTTRTMENDLVRDELDSLILLLNNNTNIKFEIGIHTNTLGTDSFNLEFSKKTGQMLYEYLVLFGVDRNQIVLKCYGEEYPIFSHETVMREKNANQRKKMNNLNRRVEVKVLSIMK